MSYTPDSTAAAALASKARGMHWLFECYFTTGVQRYTTAPRTVNSPNGNTYTGLGSFISSEDLQETTQPDAGTINLRIGIVNKAMLALLVGDQSVYRGRPIIILAQFFDRNFKEAGQPIVRWTGVMNTAKVHREKPSEDNGMTHGYIEVPCLRHGFERSRMAQGIRMTHEQQIQSYPMDKFFSFMAAMIEKPQPWLTVAFQKQQ